MHRRDNRWRTCLWPLLLLAPASVSADALTTAVTGSFNRSQENGCIQVSVFYYRVDCSYENARQEIDAQPIPWVGPTVNPIYYEPGSPQTLLPYVPLPGDRRIEPKVSGTLTIDRGRPDTGADDTVSGTLIVGPAARSVVTRTGSDANALRAIESWMSITHTLPVTPVTAASPNESGGLDYVVGAKGFPSRLCRKQDPQDCFPSAEASLTTDGKWGAGTWAAPGTAPVGRSPALGGNIGATTTAVVAGYRCADNTVGADCRRGISIWGAQEDPGLDNLLLRITTDAEGRVISVAGFWTQEYRVGMGPPALQSPPGQDDSWLGGYLELQAAAMAPYAESLHPKALLTVQSAPAYCR